MKTNARFPFLLVFIFTVIQFLLQIFFFIINMNFDFNFCLYTLCIFIWLFISLAAFYPSTIHSIFGIKARKAFSLKGSKKDYNPKIDKLETRVKYCCSIITAAGAIGVIYWIPIWLNIFSYDWIYSLSWWNLASLINIVLFTIITAPWMYLLLMDVRKIKRPSLSLEELELEEVLEQNERMKE